MWSGLRVVVVGAGSAKRQAKSRLEESGALVGDRVTHGTNLLLVAGDVSEDNEGSKDADDPAGPWSQIGACRLRPARSQPGDRAE